MDSRNIISSNAQRTISVRAAAMPPKKPKEFSIVSWYNGNMATAANVFINNVLEYTDDDLENKHDFIQLLFPLPWPSQITSSTVVATRHQFGTIRGQRGQAIRRTMLKALERILAMFDLELTPSRFCTAFLKAKPGARHRNGGRRIRRITATAGDGIDHAAREARFQALANPGNHHHRRITRIIRSLRLSGRPQDADSVYRFFRNFAREHPSVPRRTLEMWGVAANSAYLDMDPSEDIKNTTKEVKMGEPSDGESETSTETGTETTKAPSTDGTGKEGGEEGGGGGGGSGGSKKSSSIETITDVDSGGGFVRFDTPPRIVEGPTNGGQPAEIGDSRMSEEDIQKLTPPERDLHYARIQHRKENINTEIKLNLRKADGEWKGKDEDPMTMVLIELRVWQLILRDLEEERRADEITRNRIEQGNEPDDSSSDSGDDDDDANDGKEFIRTDVKKFGQRDISAEDLQKLELWERKLHFALIEHMKDYLDIEIKHKYRDGDSFWRGRGPEPTTMSLRALKAWQIEMDKRESAWMDQVMAGERAWSDDVASDTSFDSDYDIGDANMSDRYFAWLGDEDKERHLALKKYTEIFRTLEYELGFRDRTTFKWIAMTIDPAEMNLDELEQWSEDMNEMGCEWEDKKEAEEAAAAAAAAAANTNTTQPTTETETQSQPRLRSPEGLEMEEMMEERRRMGLDPLGDSPEARRWRAMMAAKAEAERLEAERLAAETESDGPGDQLRTEEAARAKTAQSSRRSAGERSDSSRSKRRRLG